jgi:chromatin remodeling complex protein RSC6
MSKTLEKKSKEPKVVKEETVSEEEVKEEKKPKAKAKAKRVRKPKAEGEEKVLRVRREVSRDSVEGDFVDLEERLASEIETLRDSKEKVKGIRFLRSINKMVKTLHKDYLRVLKIKKRRPAGENSNGGFNKPVGIRKELADFTGWDVNQKHSRISVTRFICKYIKEHDLQNPEDRRQILPDDKLAKVLRFDTKTAKEPLTYFRLQVYVQWLFIKEEKPEETKKVETKKVETPKEEKPKAKAKKVKS